jgi:hypothetical protein
MPPFPDHRTLQHAFLALVFCTAACADVGIRVETSGLGNAPIGVFLKRHWHFSDGYIASNIPIELNKLMPPTSTPQSVAVAIETYGFHCGPRDVASEKGDLTCSFDGYVVIQIVEFFGNTALGKPIRPKDKTNLHIEVAWSTSNPTPRASVKRSTTQIEN